MEPYFVSPDGRVVLYCGDALEILPELDWRLGDMVVSDPPYGTGGWRRTESGQGDNPSGSLVREDWDDGAVGWLSAVDTDAVMTFWPAARTCALLIAADAAGLTKHRTLYMRKPDPKPLPGGRTRWSVEPIWVLSRDGFVLLGGDDMCEASTPRVGRDAGATGHPYEKPLRVMTWLIAKTSRQRIVDPFAGSGTTLVAAQMLGRQAVGIEADEHWCAVTARRLSQQVLPLGGPHEPP